MHQGCRFAMHQGCRFAMHQGCRFAMHQGCRFAIAIPKLASLFINCYVNDFIRFFCGIFSIKVAQSVNNFIKT
jgi:hypothetical protein